MNEFIFTYFRYVSLISLSGANFTLILVGKKKILTLKLVVTGIGDCGVFNNDLKIPDPQKYLRKTYIGDV